MNDSLTDLLFNRNESALLQISKKYGKLIKRIAYNILGSESDSEECVNDVLMEIWNTIPPARPNSISSYSCMLARRTAIDCLRKNTAKKRGGAGYYIALEEIEDCLSDSSELTEGEITDALNDFLFEISSLDRQIFIARYFAFENISDIAKKFSLSNNSINIRLHRIREKLKKYLYERNIFI